MNKKDKIERDISLTFDFLRHLVDHPEMAAAMAKTTIRLSEFTRERLREIAGRKRMSVSQLIDEIALRYIGAEEGARMMQERAARGSKAKALAALEAVRDADMLPAPGDGLPQGADTSP